MSQTVTHKDLARKLKVSETTIKSYRRKFSDCIPVASKGKPIRFLPEAVVVCTRIRDLFDLGMSVEEVRGRLAQEFPWISLVQKDEKSSAAQPGGMPQEFTIALSNLAKSMVTLLQQQNQIVDRMDKLEKAFSEGVSITAVPQDGLKPADFKNVIEDLQEYLRNALTPLQQLQRLSEVSSVTDVLHQAAGSMVDAAQIMRTLAKSHGAENMPEAPSKVVQFPGSGSPAAPVIQQSGTQDPPRSFLLKPMVVRNVDGAYIGAGGKTRGRFTLNDFKALLVYGRQPGEHFSLHWEQQGPDWVVTLAQPGAQPGGENPGKWQLTLKEAMSQSGVGVVELIKFVIGDEAAHPAEFVKFVANLAGA
ncbi:MAG: hypothetical protein DELT_00002 [Desulfovibrio sp.]